MNLKRLMIMAAALCLAVGAVSCKKDKDDDSATSESFSGTLSVQGVLPFVLKGATVTAKPAGLGKEKVDIGYYWTASPLYTARDTTRRLGDPSSVTGAYECKIKDTLCTVTISCTAYATGYYTKSASAYCTIVDPAFGGSLTNDGVSQDMPSITDARDGNVYYYRKIGDKDWFVRNLASSGEWFLTARSSMHENVKIIFEPNDKLGEYLAAVASYNKEQRIKERRGEA